jgi:hypothetical protein
VAERALNHKVRDVEGVYNQYDYFDERKRALDRWARLLLATSRGEPFNVVGIRQRARA